MNYQPLNALAASDQLETTPCSDGMSRAYEVLQSRSRHFKTNIKIMKYLLIILLFLTACSPTAPGSYYKAYRGWMNQDLRSLDIPDPDTTLVIKEGPIIRRSKTQRDTS
jgi:hypothetical protein